MHQLAVSLLLVTAPAAADQAAGSRAGGTPVAATEQAPGGERRDYAQISIEELLDRDIAVAATKTRVDVSRAPVSVTVLTPDDIRRSGATSLGDLFRQIPGIDVLESFPGHTSVSARGTSEFFVNNMLVLIDGRRLEFQAAGVPFLAKAPVRLEDIKRIEVVKGPVGALYGTNALAGIISISTYDPEDVPGTLVSVSGGTRDSYETTLRQAGRLGGAWSYKLVGGYSYTSTWASLDDLDTNPSVALRKGDLLGVVQRRFDGDARFELEAGLTKGDMASLTVVTNQQRFFTWPHLRAAYSRPDFVTQLTWSPQSSELRERTGPVQPLTDRAHAVNLSVDRTLRPFSTSAITLGGNLRYQRSTFTNIGSPHAQTVWGVFVQDEQVLVADRVTLYGAVGLSGHPEVPTQVDGSAALVVTPVKDHALRVSAGRAHRDPSFNENFFDFPRRFGNRDGYQAPNRDLRPESLVSVEVGYHGKLRLGGGSLRLFAEGFLERLRDLMGVVTRNVPPGTIAKHPSAVVVQQFQNLEDRDGHGFESGFDWERSSLRLAAHYSYQSFENARTGETVRRDVPAHKVSSGLHLQRGSLSLASWVHYVSRTAVEDGYLLVNPRVALRVQGWELSLAAFNALDDRHVETTNERGFKGELVRRSVSVTLTRTFGRR